MKRKRPYFRVSIKGYYPKDSTSKMSVNLYTENGSIIGRLIELWALLMPKGEKGKGV